MLGMYPASTSVQDDASVPCTVSKEGISLSKRVPEIVTVTFVTMGREETVIPPKPIQG